MTDPEEDQTDYIALHPNEDAFDFPCSYDWRAYYRKTAYGEYLPPIEPREPEREIITKHFHIRVNEVSLKLNKRVGVVEAKVKYLLEKQKERRIASRNVLLKE